MENLTIDLVAGVEDVESLIDKLLVDITEHRLYLRDSDLLSDDCSVIAELHLTDAFICCKAPVEGRTVLLDPWHLHIRIVEIAEIITPVRIKEQTVITHIHHVDDAIDAFLCLDDKFDAILANCNGEVRT